jgi:hypothetical protein
MPQEVSRQVWRALVLRSSLPPAFLGPHMLVPIAVDWLLCQLSQTELMTGGWVSERLCGN